MNEKLPIKASAGANNGLYAYCDKYGYRRKYFLCLNTIEAHEGGRLKEGTLSEECGRACDLGSCAAKIMRQQEIDAGHAIHFELDKYHAKKTENKPKGKGWDYTAARKIVGVQSKSPVREIKRPGGVSSLKTTKPKAKPESKAEPEIKYESMDIGKLVTDMAKEETKVEKIAPTATQKPKNKPLPGESMLDMAKRLMKERKSK